MNTKQELTMWENIKCSRNTNTITPCWSSKRALKPHKFPNTEMGIQNLHK